MKKCAAMLLTLLLLLGLSVTAFADLGEPEFDNWYVVCGPRGYDYSYTEEDIMGSNVTRRGHIEPGIRFMVFEYLESEKEYRLILEDDQKEAAKVDSFVYLSSSDLDKNFISEKKVVQKETGKMLDEEVTAVVTPDVGVILRQGPARTYKSYRTIPKNTQLTYQYTYAYGGYTWGYTTYKGTSGWCALDYTEKVVPTTETTTETTTQPTSESTTADTTAAIATVPPTGSIPAENDKNRDQPNGFFSDTKTVIVVCCLCAVILALTAVVILLIVKRKKETPTDPTDPNMGGYDGYSGEDLPPYDLPPTYDGPGAEKSDEFAGYEGFDTPDLTGGETAPEAETPDPFADLDGFDDPDIFGKQ